MQTEADWKQIAEAAKSRETAMFALGVSAGLRWAKEQQDEKNMVPSISLAAAAKGLQKHP